MFERFTERARRVVVLAQEEARRHKHEAIGTEHILLGFLADGEGVAGKALAELGIELDQVRKEVISIIGEGEKEPQGHVPFTPRAKKVMELSLREALQLGHNYVGTEHILLGLIREGEGVAAQTLVRLGADLAAVRQKVIQLLSGYSSKPTRRTVNIDEAEWFALLEVETAARRRMAALSRQDLVDPRLSDALTALQDARNARA